MSAEINETIKVYVRQRPIITNKSEIANGSKTSGIRSVSSDGTRCSYYAAVNNSVQEFKMDKIFRNESLQSDIYDIVAKPLITSALQGYSGTVFAYGPTNSGKTFTMRGGEGEQKGIIPRSVTVMNEPPHIMNMSSLQFSHADALSSCLRNGHLPTQKRQIRSLFWLPMFKYTAKTCQTCLYLLLLAIRQRSCRYVRRVALFSSRA